MSRRDLVHVLEALWRLSGGTPEVGVSVADIDDAIGRGHRDMRTPLNLQSLGDDGLVAPSAEGAWALTARGVAWLEEDRELSDLKHRPSRPAAGARGRVKRRVRLYR